MLHEEISEKEANATECVNDAPKKGGLANLKKFDSKKGKEAALKRWSSPKKFANVRNYIKQTCLEEVEKRAEAIAKAVGAEALPISTPVTEQADVLFLGNSYYAFSIDPEVRDFVRALDKNKVGKIVNFGSAAMLNSTYKKVKAEADKVGIPMDEREFHCKGNSRASTRAVPIRTT